MPVVSFTGMPGTTENLLNQIAAPGMPDNVKYAIHSDLASYLKETAKIWDSLPSVIANKNQTQIENIHEAIICNFHGDSKTTSDCIILDHSPQWIDIDEINHRPIPKVLVTDSRARSLAFCMQRSALTGHTQVDHELRLLGSPITDYYRAKYLLDEIVNPCLECIQRCITRSENGQVLVVSYQDIINSPTTSLRKIMAFAGIKSPLKPITLNDDPMFARRVLGNAIFKLATG